ncbi:hypothetical protein GCM10010484_00220 [Actinokineospora globicatena]
MSLRCTETPHPRNQPNLEVSMSTAVTEAPHSAIHAAIDPCPAPISRHRVPRPTPNPANRLVVPGSQRCSPNDSRSSSRANDVANT